MTEIIARMRENDRRLVRVHADGREEVLQKRPIRPMAEAEIEAAAASDPDARPHDARGGCNRAAHSSHQDAATRPCFDAGEVRGAFRIPLGALRDWEQGRSAPDQPARAYLTVIARDPEGVRRALPAGAERG